MRCRAQDPATAMFDGMAKFSQVVGVPLVAVPLVWFGWRGAFWMTAGLSFLFLIVFWISYRDPSEDAHLSPVERDYILAGGARPRVERGRHGRNLVDAMHAEISAFWKILAQQSVGVLVGAALPRAVRIAEIDLDAERRSSGVRAEPSQLDPKSATDAVAQAR